MQVLLGAEHRNFLLPIGEVPIYMSKSSSKPIGTAVMDAGRATAVLNINVSDEVRRFWHTYKKTYDSTVMDDDKSGTYMRKRLDTIILHKTD